VEFPDPLASLILLELLLDDFLELFLKILDLSQRCFLWGDVIIGLSVFLDHAWPESLR
jgi:hypothetical protein